MKRNAPNQGSAAGVPLFRYASYESVAKLPDPEVFRLRADYRLSGEQMLAAGRYGRKNFNTLPDEFVIAGEGVVEMEARYCQFDCEILSKDAAAMIKLVDTRNPWMPAPTEYVLSLGAARRGEQLKFPIVGLGSIAEINGLYYVPYLTKLGVERCFYIFPADGFFARKCRFLAIRPVSIL
ncbi:MAG: hypothetical protein ACYC48_00725 [Minisyncoccota bacterium]